MSNDGNCPYCQAEQDFDYEEFYEEDTAYIHECLECHKNMAVRPYYSVDYCIDPSPCNNGEPHVWKHMMTPKMIGCEEPAYDYFKHRYRCSLCGEEQVFVSGPDQEE